eukprot:637459-Prymnesium_polylepis.1
MAEALGGGGCRAMRSRRRAACSLRARPCDVAAAAHLVAVEQRLCRVATCLQDLHAADAHAVHAVDAGARQQPTNLQVLQRQRISWHDEQDLPRRPRLEPREQRQHVRERLAAARLG